MVKNTVKGVTCSDWQNVAVRGSHAGRQPLTAVNRADALTAGSEQGLESRILGLNRSRSATLPAAMKVNGGGQR
jgi:hypothetical protein